MTIFSPRAFLIAVCILTLVARAQPRVEYHVTLDEPQTQMVDIAITLRGVETGTVDLHLPTWRPGRYVVLDMSGTIHGERASDGAGNELSIRKTAKSTWRIETGGADTVRVDYRIYANSINDRTRHVDDTHAFLSGSSVFMYADEWRDEELRVTIDAPTGWGVATGLEPENDDLNVVVAPNYDILVDSPIEIGVHRRFWFEVDNIPHEIVIWGRAEPDEEKLKDDFAAIVRAQADLFGDIPYERYVFLIQSGAGLRGGTEHWNSTIMLTRPESFTDDDAYESFLGLVSHEVFHIWNVKRLRPAGITPYDYQSENYTDLFWVAEGTTSYYDDLILARTGLIEEDEYLDRISSSIDGYRRTPGRKIQSLTDSSWDAWIKFNKRTPDSPNSTVSFYRKGALVSLLLDLELRFSTENAYTLDDLMRELYENHPLESGGFTQDDLRGTIAEHTPMDVDAFFASFVDGTDPLPLEEKLGFVGLELIFEHDDEEEQEGAYAGVRLGSGEGAPVVRTVYADGPAYKSGLMPDDEVLAINGLRVRTAGDFDGTVEDSEPGEKLTLTIARRDEVREMEITLIPRPAGEWVIRKVAEPTDAQRERYEDWMHQPFDSVDESAEPDPGTD